jgi:hypothetical protein
MIGARQSSPWIIFTALGSGSTIFTEESSSVWKNTSGGSVVFLATAFTRSSTSVFFARSMCLTVNHLK